MEFGEAIWWRKRVAKTELKKLEVMWDDGVYLGFDMRSCERFNIDHALRPPQRYALRTGSINQKLLEPTQAFPKLRVLDWSAQAT